MEDKEVDDFLKFVNIANDVCKEKGKLYEFICPECNGKAIAIRDEFNGHLYAKCEGCDMSVIQ